ncbi:MAG TPA: prephenate dehydrogenase [Methanobacteriaceae archaeon]|nr:prephenate dehydrogenase [Methanobacteriaceae archaeon]
MKVAVIGGTRGLGYWIASYLKEKEQTVTITGRDSLSGKSAAKHLGVFYTSDNKIAAKSDVVILAVPIESTAAIIKELAPLMRKGSLLIDVTSVKEDPANLMEKYAPEGVEVLPTHPMFGPRVRSLEGQVVVLTPEKKGKWYPIVVDFLKKEKARVISTTPEIHDRMMSIVQGLTHFAYISIAATIQKMEIDVKESRKFSSPIYSLMLDMIARIVAQNPYLCYSIQTKNRHIGVTHQKFLETFQELKGMIEDENQEEFVNVMSSAAKHLDDLEASLGRSDKAIFALNAEISTLKNSLGQEVGVRHIYSGNIHVGILEELTPEFLYLNNSKKVTKLKLANVETLSQVEIFAWKKTHLPLKSYDVSIIFPANSNPELIALGIQKLEGVIDAELIDVYQGDQLPTDSHSITIRYHVLDPQTRFDVEMFLKGFGGKIR